MRNFSILFLYVCKGSVSPCLQNFVRKKRLDDRKTFRTFMDLFAQRSLIQTKKKQFILLVAFTIKIFQNFPSILMSVYLSKQGEKVQQLKEHSIYWIILAECKLNQQLYSDVWDVLKDAYKAKAKVYYVML